MTDQNIIPLGEQSQNTGSLIDAESARAIQEVQASLIIAKKFPRDEETAVAKIQKACLRPSLADAGLYTYARGGTSISGPSIRLAEAVAQYWGNLDFGWRELDRKGGSSTIQAYCWEKETNTRREMTFEVKHFRSTKKGGYVLTDERDIYENNANNAARRMRACILAVIPGDVIEDAVMACERTIANQVTEDGVNKMIQAFSRYGVNIAMVEARIQRKIAAIQPANVVDLRKIYNSLKDGMSSVSTWFDLELADKAIEVQQVQEETSIDKFNQEQAAPTQEAAQAPAQPVAAPTPQATQPAPQAVAVQSPPPPLVQAQDPAQAAFPGCMLCEGSGLIHGTDPTTGEVTKGPCPECSNLV